MNNRDKAWDRFIISGKIEDYLEFNTYSVKGENAVEAEHKGTGDSRVEHRGK